MRSRIAEACAAAGRDQQSVTLIAVTKTYPASDIVALARLGVRNVGESKDQEARAKLAELDEFDKFDNALAQSLRWHVVGRLQTNKANSVARYASAVHSVDRAKLSDALADAVRRIEDHVAALDVFCQVSLDGDPDRGGVLPDELDHLAERVAARDELRLRGLMAVAPQRTDPERAFAQLAELSARLRRDHPQAAAISAGMSGDLEAAIGHGATHVRVGSALLGRREPDIG